MATNPLIASTPVNGLAADARSLDALRTQAGTDPQKAIRQAASQFEALFMRQLLKSMRDAIPKSGMWDGPAQSMYTDMFDQQLAQTMSGRAGGLGEVIARQLSRNVQGGLPEGAAGGAAAGVQSGAAAGRTAATGWRSTLAMAAGAGDAVARRAVGTRATEAPSAMPDLKNLSPNQADFVRRMWPQAMLAEQSTGVPAAFVVGQAALESGWGRSEIRNADGSSSHNLFGIKAGRNWRGPVAEAVTTEYVDGKPRKQVERFRAYGSYAEAFQDWAGLMASNPRYRGVLNAGSSVEGFAAGMQRAGYATDQAYGAKLEKTINRALMLKRLVT